MKSGAIHTTKSRSLDVGRGVNLLLDLALGLLGGARGLGLGFGSRVRLLVIGVGVGLGGALLSLALGGGAAAVAAAGLALEEVLAHPAPLLACADTREMSAERGSVQGRVGGEMCSLRMFFDLLMAALVKSWPHFCAAERSQPRASC